MAKVRQLSDAFGGREAEETKDLIVLGVGVHSSGSVTLSEGKWVDLEELVMTLTNDTSQSLTFGFGAITKDEIRKNPNNFSLRCSYTDGTNEFIGIFSANGDNTASYSVSGHVSTRIKQVTARKKKYATTNLTETLQVNGGNDITTNARYEITASELPSNFLNPDGSIKENLQLKTQIKIDGVWVDQPLGFYINASNDVRYYGVDSYVVGNLIVVLSAGVGALVTSGAQMSLTNAYNVISTGNSKTINSAQCQVIATLSGEAYTVQTA